MKRFIVLDTEATNTGKESAARFGVGASVYDLGYVVADATGAVYYQNRIMSVPIFPTVHSTLPVTLVPFSEYDPGDNNPRSDTLITVREPNL